MWRPPGARPACLSRSSYRLTGEVRLGSKAPFSTLCQPLPLYPINGRRQTAPVVTVGAMSRQGTDFFARIMMDIATGARSLRKDWNSKVTLQSGIVDLGQFDLTLSVR